MKTFNDPIMIQVIFVHSKNLKNKNNDNILSMKATWNGFGMFESLGSQKKAMDMECQA